MLLVELRRWLRWPCLSLLAQWCLLFWPHAALTFCPPLWAPAGQRTALWDFLDRNLVPIATAIVCAFYTAATVGVINLFLPRFLASFVNRVVMAILNCSLLPVLRLLRSRHTLEFGAYVLAFAVSAQACRYPTRQERAAACVGLLGGWMFVLCYALSSLLHARACHRLWIILTMAVYCSGMFIPISLRHSTQAAGFVAVLACHIALTLLLTKIGCGYRFGDGWKNMLCCGVIASCCLFSSFMLMRFSVSDQSQLQPFAMGGVCFGHIAYFAMLVVLSSKWVVDSDDWFHWQGVMVISLSVVLFLGKVFDILALNSAMFVAMLCWLFVKELELKGDNLAVKVLAGYVLYQFLEKDSLMTMLDPKGLYI